MENGMICMTCQEILAGESYSDNVTEWNGINICTSCGTDVDILEAESNTMQIGYLHNVSDR